MFYRIEKNTTYLLSMYIYLDIKISVKYLEKFRKTKHVAVI